MLRVIQITVTILLLFTFTSCVHSARILGFFPVPSISHQVVFRQLYHELAKRGHEVVVITPDPAFAKNESLPNLTEIDVHDLSYSLWRDFWVSKINVGNTNDLYGQLETAYEMFSIIVESQLQTKEVKELINDNDKKFDLLLLETSVKTTLALSHIFKAPVIAISSLGPCCDNSYVIGAPTHPVIFPQATSSFKQNKLTYWDKIIEIYVHWRVSKIFETREIKDDQMLKKLIDSNIPSLTELSNNIDMMFFNSHCVWDTNRPVPPNVIYIGGIHLNTQKELPKDLESYLNSSKHGVIYFSFGTNTMPSTLKPDIIQTFLKVFSKLPYDVLWKWDADELPGKTTNIKIFKWLPQSDLLNHPKVKLFITQGGLQSTDEAISAGVPLIGIPMLGDQWYNVEKYVQLKIGLRLDFDSITEDNFENAITTIINDKSYRENIRELRSIVDDQPQTALERAVWWTEYVLRHGGAKHLRSPSANMSWTKYYEIELIIFILMLLITLIAVTLIFVWMFAKSLFTTPTKSKKM